MKRHIFCSTSRIVVGKISRFKAKEQKQGKADQRSHPEAILFFPKAIDVSIFQSQGGNLQNFLNNKYARSDLC
jgi:hypothetical protein